MWKSSAFGPFPEMRTYSARWPMVCSAAATSNAILVWLAPTKTITRKSALSSTSIAADWTFS
jgi:hypothetical protein